MATATTTLSTPGAQQAPPSIQQVLYALQVLCTTSWDEPNIKRDANRWLEHFQTTIEAWTIADQLLQLPASNETTNIHYFGAQTLHMKIQLKYQELPASARNSLKESLLNHMRKFCVGPQHVVVTQLCVALALLALQMEEWTDPVQDVAFIFTPKQGEAIPDNVRSGMLSCLLEFLTVLPEESGNKRVLLLSERRVAFYRMLDKHASDIVQLLANYFQLAGSNKSMQAKVFKCLLSWLKYSSLLTTVVNSTNVFGGGVDVSDIFLKMISFAFDSLSSHELIETAVDVISEATRQSAIEMDRSKGEQELVLPHIGRLLLQNILQLREKYLKDIFNDRSVTQGHEDEVDGDIDEVKGFCRIFAEFGESFVDVISLGSNEALALIETLLRFVDYPDAEVVGVTVWFWYRLSKTMESRIISPTFVQVFTRLVVILIHQLKFPHDFEGWSKVDQDEFRNWRKELSDVLKDAAAVLTGDQCLAVIYQSFEQYLAQFAANQVSWREVEACLYGIRSISPFVSKSNPLLSKVMDALPNLPNQGYLHYSTMLLFANYAEWVREHPTYIPIAFNTILSGFSNQKLHAAATNSLKSLCRSCRGHLTTYLDNLLAVYEACGKMDLALHERGEVAAAVSYAMSPLPNSTVLSILQRILVPSIVSINQQASLVSVEPAQMSNVSKHISVELFMIFSIFKNLEMKALAPNETHPCIEVMKGSWSVWTALFQFCKADENIMDNLCFVFKYAARSNPEQFTMFLTPTVKLLVDSFSTNPHSCFIYLANVIVGEYAHRGQNYLEILTSMLGMFSMQTFELLKTPSNFRTHSDVVEEFFEFVIKYIRNSPLSIARQDLQFWRLLFDCALGGLEIVHSKKAIESMLAFFEQLFKKMEDSNELKVVVQNIMQTHGVPIVKELVIGYAEHLPTIASYWVSNVLKMMRDCWANDMQGWMIAVLSGIPDNMLSATEKDLLLRVFLRAGDKQEIADFLDHFTQLYGGRSHD
eukprot:TRINITY_DN6847_c0_g1_i1.p1 TRINITY_DN6847_c0_g1~~TRINITY_DN6847_c0_g1_i1.p1  ORF type:complete len:986 (-),score=188.68 TRINITY_DN6847_c0_g1_i1:63-3020(-)